MSDRQYQQHSVTHMSSHCRPVIRTSDGDVDEEVVRVLRAADGVHRLTSHQLRADQVLGQVEYRTVRRLQR